VTGGARPDRVPRGTPGPRLHRHPVGPSTTSAGGARRPGRNDARQRRPAGSPGARRPLGLDVKDHAVGPDDRQPPTYVDRCGASGEIQEDSLGNASRRTRCPGIGGKVTSRRDVRRVFDRAVHSAGALSATLVKIPRRPGIDPDAGRDQGRAGSSSGCRCVLDGIARADPSASALPGSFPVGNVEP